MNRLGVATRAHRNSDVVQALGPADIKQEELLAAMAYKNLEEALQAAGSPVTLLRDSQIGP